MVGKQPYPPYRYEMALLLFRREDHVAAATALRRGFVENGYIAEILCGNPEPPPMGIWHGDGFSMPVESGAGAPASGSGGCSVAFAPGLSPAPMAAFPGPRSPNPACRFPAPGSPAGSCASHTDHRDEVGAGPVTRQTVAAARRPSCLPYRRRCAAEPVHASTTSNRSGSTPSLLHVMRSELSALRRGYRQSHSRRLSSFPHPSAPEAPSLRRHYPASAVLRASPPPCRPGLPLAGFRLARARHRQGFPCCHHSPLPCVPPPLPRRSRPVRVARFPAGGSLPRYSGGSASAMPVSRPARRSLRVAVAVGKRVTPLPPLRSPHARWGTGLLPRVFDGKTHRRPRVPNLDGWPMQCGNAHDIGDRGPVLL